MQQNGVIDLRNYRTDASDDGTSEAPPSDVLPAGTTLLHGQYTIARYLNMGGFGITYLATDSLSRDVVIKECFPSQLCVRTGKHVVVRNADYSQEFESIVGHFVAEAHSLANMDHRNIVRVHQVFKENATAYMAIDFVDGKDLLDIADNPDVRLTPEAIVQIAAKALGAIRYIHKLGMLHLDISPDNILVDTKGEPVLIDFGAARERAKMEDEALALPRFVKDGYSAPELYVVDSPRGPWTDLYSFAASLYHLVTGAAPVDAETRMKAVKEKQPDPYRPIADITPGYPVGFLQTIDEALSLAADERLQSADKWLKRLKITTKTLEAKRVKTRVFGNTDAPIATAATAAADKAEAEVRRSIIAKDDVTPLNRLPLVAGAAMVGFVAFAVVGYLFARSGDTPAPVEIAAEQPAEPSEATPAPADAAATTPAVASAVTVAPSATEPETATPPADTAGTQEPAPTIATTSPVPGAPPEADAATTITTQSGVTRPAGLAALSDPVAVSGVPIAAPAASDRPDTLSTMQNLVDVTPGTAPRVPAKDGSTDSERQVAALTQPAVTEGPSVDLAAPAPLPEEAPSARVVPAPEPGITVGASDLRLAMPFTADLERVRKANTATITSVAEGADLEVSGPWIKPGAVILTFNGEPLREGMTIEQHMLRNLTVDPDGYVRATVRYRDPESGAIERALLAAPVIHSSTLDDGTVVEARIVDLDLRISVVEPGSERGTTLQEGDVLLSEETSNTPIIDLDALHDVVGRLAANNVRNAEFRVLRGSEVVTADMSLRDAN